MVCCIFIYTCFEIVFISLCISFLTYWLFLYLSCPTGCSGVRCLIFTYLWIFQSSVYVCKKKKKKCIQLLSGWFCKYLLDEFGVKYSSNPLFTYWFCVWLIYSLLKVGYWSPLLLHCYVFMTSDLLVII